MNFFCFWLGQFAAHRVHLQAVHWLSICHLMQLRFLRRGGARTMTWRAYSVRHGWKANFLSPKSTFTILCYFSRCSTIICYRCPASVDSGSCPFLFSGALVVLVLFPLCSCKLVYSLLHNMVVIWNLVLG